MASILITGAHGFIGQHLAQLLSSLGHEIYGLGHGIWPESEAAASGICRWFNGDIDAGNLRNIQRVMGIPDQVFHLAGGSSVGTAIAQPREDFYRTVSTTAELLDWIRLDAPQTRLVVISSAAIFGSGHARRLRTDDSIRPFSPYGYHKRLMEELCESYAATFGVSVVIARLFSVYGTRLKKQLLWDLCSRLCADTNAVLLGGTGQELRDWTHVSDVVHLLSSLPQFATSGKPCFFNVGTGTATPVSQVARDVLAAWEKLTGQARSVEFSGLSRPGDPFSLVADHTEHPALQSHWKTPLATGLADYVAWFCGLKGLR